MLTVYLDAAIYWIDNYRNVGDYFFYICLTFANLELLKKPFIFGKNFSDLLWIFFHEFPLPHFVN